MKERTKKETSNSETANRTSESETGGNPETNHRRLIGKGCLVGLFAERCDYACNSEPECDNLRSTETITAK